MKSTNGFRKFAVATSQAVGSPWAFSVAVAVILVWGITGPLFSFSDTWQLVINTGTTIVTFLMVFLIQSTQNRDAIAIHLKLDELIRGIDGPRTGLVDLEDMSDEQLARLQQEFARLRNENTDTLDAPIKEAVEAPLQEIAEERAERRRGVGPGAGK